MTRWRTFQDALAEARTAAAARVLAEAHEALAAAEAQARALQMHREETLGRGLLNLDYLEAISGIEAAAWGHVEERGAERESAHAAHCEAVQARIQTRSAVDLVEHRRDSAIDEWQDHQEKIGYDRMADMRVAWRRGHD
ncbi:hypothetical protein [Solilutibacter silvestris]|uniref:hypothetical protein n=1 Tax=Solilutibacter silvestris TaxID=1645665 RepID=UPI003D357AE3